MIRIYDLDVINSYLKQPDILPEFFIAEPVHIYRLDVFFMLGNAGLFVCIQKGKDMDCHAAIPHENRGKKAVDDCKALIDWVFTHTACNRVVTRADKTKRHLLVFNAKILTRCGVDDKYVHYEVLKDE